MQPSQLNKMLPSLCEVGRVEDQWEIPTRNSRYPRGVEVSNKNVVWLAQSWYSLPPAGAEVAEEGGGAGSRRERREEVGVGVGGGGGWISGDDRLHSLRSRSEFVLKGKTAVVIGLVQTERCQAAHSDFGSVLRSTVLRKTNFSYPWIYSVNLKWTYISVSF
jgi:hypothetical protein